MYVGPPPATARSSARRRTANAFFPSKLKVNVGDSVAFVPAGFHNVDLPKKGEAAMPFIVPTGQKVAGSLDAAGAPFWFNGQDALEPQPRVPDVRATARSSPTRRQAASVGPAAATKPKPMTVKFTKAGTYNV